MGDALVTLSNRGVFVSQALNVIGPKIAVGILERADEAFW